jgi:hypothetical protein
MMSTTSVKAKSMYMKRNERSFHDTLPRSAGLRPGVPRSRPLRGTVSPQASRLRCAKRRLSRMGPGFHAQAVDFPHLRVRNSECGARNVTQSLGRFGPLGQMRNSVLPDWHYCGDFGELSRAVRNFRKGDV